MAARKKTTKRKRAKPRTNKTLTRPQRDMLARAAKEEERSGRPTKYEVKFNMVATRLALLGFKDPEMAEYFGVSVSTIQEWLTAHPRFYDAVHRGRESADGLVAESLFMRAIGYSHTEDKIFHHEGEITIVPTVKHYPPETGAAMNWLTNRQRERWSNKQEVDLGMPTVVIRSYTGRRRLTEGEGE